MTTAALYFASAALSLWLADRWIVRISRAAAIALLLVPLCFTGRALLTGRVYAPIDLAFGSEPLYSSRALYGVGRFHNGMLGDVYCLNIPWKYAVRVAYSQGEWPLWNPFIFCGDILAASAQPTPYEPFFLLSLLLPAANSLTYLATMTFFLAALTMFLFLREIGCSEIASITGAATWTFCAFLSFWLEWVITPSTLWFPLILIGVCRIVRGGHGMAILTVAFVMMLLNGHPESALHLVTLGLIWAAVELWYVRGRGLTRAAALGVGAGAIALLLTAIYMLPILEAIPQTFEGAYRRNVYAYKKKSVPFPIALEHLQTQIIPFRFGDTSEEWPKNPDFDFTESAYCGSVVLPVAIFGLWRSRRREKWLALGFIAFGMLIGNQIWPFTDLLARLPLFRVALNSRLILAAAFGIALLTALGADVILEQGRQRALAFLAALVAVLLGIACASAWTSMQSWGLSEAFLRERTAMLLVPLVLLALVAMLPRSRMIVCAAILALVLAQRTIEAADFYPTLPASMFYPQIPLLDRLPKTGEPYRIVGQGRMFTPNIATMYRLEDVRGYQAMTFDRLRATYALWCVPQAVWYNRVDDLTRPLLSMMNVRYSVAPKGVTPPEGWTKFAEGLGGQLFENSRVLPRAYIPRNVRVADPARELFEMLEETDFGWRSWIAIPGEPPHDAVNGIGRLAVTRRGMRRFDIRASMETGAWIVISECGWKGWRVRRDGKSVKLHRANNAFLAVYAPPGEHQIELAYWPQSFVIGRAVSLSTVVVLLGIGLWRRRRVGGAPRNRHH